MISVKVEKHSFFLYISVACCLVSLCNSAKAESTDAFSYAGKVITMIVSVPGGSGGDVTARTVAREWSTNIPGEPFIIVKNLVGAGGATALNFVYERAKPDGLTVYWGPWNPLDVLEGGKGIRFVPEEFGIVGSGTNMRGFIVRTNAGPGINKPADLLSVTRLKVGGRSANNILDLVGNLALKILGVSFKYVSGYRGMAQIAPSIYGEEVQAGHVASGGYNRFFTETTKKGETLLVYHHPIFDRNGSQVQPLDTLADSESFLDVYLRIHGSMPTGIYWETYKWLRINVQAVTPSILTPPGTPDHVLAILRKSVESTFQDKDFQRLWKKQFDDIIQWNHIDDTLAAFQNYRSMNKEMREVISEMSKVDWD